LLDPFYSGRATLPSSFARLRSIIERGGIHEAMPALNDAIKVNRRWMQTVATPVLRSRHPSHKLQLHGKALLDRFRADIGEIDGWLARRELLSDERAQNATVLVGTFSALAVGAVTTAALLFTIQQYRMAERLERQRAEQAEENRKSAETRAALQAEKRVAETLQEAFSQRVFPTFPAVRFSAAYLPATDASRVGGDWYDALRLSENRVLLAIGDAAGHGIDAVVAMNNARQLLISFALLDAAPASVLERVNGELVRDKSQIITAVSAVMDMKTREFAYAAAGHPPPVLFEPGRRARLLEFGSLPLGVAPQTRYRMHRVQTVPGALIVLYTDGLIEHSRNLAEGEAALLEAVESTAIHPGEDAAAAIRDRIFAAREVADDVAILTVRFSETDSSALRRIA
jgi:serine phosphatase RsbU (regulator of sigma subunit)